MSQINVTKTFLPPMPEYQEYLNKIWDKGLVTNQGPLLHEFEDRTSEYLKVENFQFVSNGTMALQLALRALDITEGEVITTPFSYVATTSAIMWEHCVPVFVDIEPNTFCIDPDKIEAAITDRTKAIMPVHVFGNPCGIEKIDAIAKKHNLKVIYDAAHAFGVEYNGRSLLDYGDISTCSFHATKLFHTIEGGCVISQDNDVNERVELLKRFGHTGDEHFTLGINAKASEFQAAMGLCNLGYVADSIKERAALTHLYDELLAGRLQRPTTPANTTYNYAYYPVVFETEAAMLDALARLNRADIFPRRYFFPSLNTLPYIETGQSCPVSEDITGRIICLPLYSGLSKNDVKRICEVLYK